MIPGVLAGVYFLTNNSLPIVTLCAGSALGIVAVLMLVSAQIAIPRPYQGPSGIMAGFLGGVLGGTPHCPAQLSLLI